MIDDDEDMPAPLGFIILPRHTTESLKEMAAHLMKDLTDGVPFESPEDEMATRNWYLTIITEIKRREAAPGLN